MSVLAFIGTDGLERKGTIPWKLIFPGPMKSRKSLDHTANVLLGLSAFVFLISRKE